MLYVDTSAFVATLLSEARSEGVRRALADNAESLAISRWTLTEAKSALSLRLRVGAISRDEAIKAETELLGEAIDSYRLVEIVQTDFDQAAALMDFDGPPLRAADALHLAIAQRADASLITLDLELAAAATFHKVPLLTL